MSLVLIGWPQPVAVCGGDLGSVAYLGQYLFSLALPSFLISPCLPVTHGVWVERAQLEVTVCPSAGMTLCPELLSQLVFCVLFSDRALACHFLFHGRVTTFSGCCTMALLFAPLGSPGVFSVAPFLLRPPFWWHFWPANVECLRMNR